MTAKRILLTICLLFGMMFIVPPAHAQLSAGGVGGDYGLSETAGAAKLSKVPIPQLIGNVIGTALSMIAVVFFILMVYGGFLWMTAHGNNDMVKKAQDTIIAAVIGIIIVLASYSITNFVFSSVDSAGGNGGGGGGGQPGQIDNARCIAAHPDRTCKDISQCTGGAAAADQAAGPAQACELLDACTVGLCPGGNNIVCCS